MDSPLFSQGDTIQMKHLTVFLFLLLALTLALPAQTQRTVSTNGIIAINTATTGSIALGSCMPAAIIVPSGWTTASLAFEASVNGTTFYTVNQYGGRRIESVAVGWNDIAAADSWAWRYMKILSVNSSGVAVNQTAERTVTVVCR
jgi:hypothetical protein